MYKKNRQYDDMIRFTTVCHTLNVCTTYASKNYKASAMFDLCN